MATASELLASIEQVDKTLVIDNDLRVINIPPSVKTLGVEYDDEVLTLDFRLPRYVSDTDLSDFSIRVNYINSNGESDMYTVSNPTIEEQFITFSWLVGPTATRYRGNTSFNVCLKTVDQDGVVEKEFNTTVASLPVLEGLEVDESIVRAHSDIIEQWRQELFGEESVIRAVSQEEQENIRKTGEDVRASLPPDYQTAVSMTENADRTKSDAIVCTAQGDIVRVDDSSDDYLRGLKIFGKTIQRTTTGKNLLEIYPEEIEGRYKGVEFTVNNDYGVVATGTPTEIFAISLYGSYDSPLAFPAGEYIVSGGVDENHRIRIRIHSSDGVLKATIYSKGADEEFTVEEGDLISISIYFANTNQVDNMVFYTMVRYASIADDTYEPYSGGEPSPNPNWWQEITSIINPTISVYGRNLASQKLKLNLKTRGMTIVTSQDSSEILLNGTVEEVFSHTILRTDYLAPGVYTISTYGVNLHDANFDRLYVADDITGKLYANYIIDGSPKTITVDTPTKLRIDMVFKENSMYENRILKIQIEAGDTATEYERCKPVQTHTIPTTFDSPLRGVPVDENGSYTDSNGQQWICDEIDFEKGVYIQRTKEIVLDGSEPWYISAAQIDEGTRFDVNLNNMPKSLVQNVVCDFFRFCGANAQVETAWVLENSYGFRIITKHASTVDDFKFMLENNPVTLIYTLQEPISIPLSEDDLNAFYLMHTNVPTTTIVNVSEEANGRKLTTTTELTYNADTKTWLENLPKADENQVRAAVDAWLEAHYTHAEGARF